MIQQIKLLTSLELKNLFGFNVFRHSTDTKAKYRYIGLTVVWILLILMVFFYVGSLSYGLILLGMSHIVPAYLIMIASIILFAFGIFKAGNMLFVQKGYDTLCSLPVLQSSIVISRFLSMYVEDLILTFIVIMPGMATYGFFIRPNLIFYLTSMISILLIPILPLVIATLIGTIITAISCRMKHKSLIQTILTMILVVVIMIVSFGTGEFAENVSLKQLANIAETVNIIIGKLYPPAIWLGNSILGKNVKGLLLCILLYLSAFTIMIVFISQNFHKICQNLFATSAKHNYRMETLKSNSVLVTLYKREKKRYFASSIYVTNTIIGPILATIMAGAILFAGIDTIQNALAIPINLTPFIPFALSVVFDMMTTTAVSISMEGKNFWIVKSLPLTTKSILDSKILLNLSLMIPFYLISEIFLIIALKPTLLELLWLVAIPLVLNVFSCVLGITINLHFYSFDWENEGTVVKQSSNTLFSMFADTFVPIFCIILIAILPEFTDLLNGIICLGLLGITGILYTKNNQTQLQKL